MSARFKLTSPVVREHPLQAEMCRVLRIEVAPPGKVSRDGVVWWACDIADYGGSVPGTRIGRGLIAGVPDLFFLFRGRAGLIEIKASDGIMGVAQQALGSALLFAGGRIGIARTCEELLLILDEWGFPRSRRVQL